MPYSQALLILEGRSPTWASVIVDHVRTAASMPVVRKTDFPGSLLPYCRGHAFLRNFTIRFIKLLK